MIAFDQKKNNAFFVLFCFTGVHKWTRCRLSFDSWAPSTHRDASALMQNPPPHIIVPSLPKSPTNQHSSPSMGKHNLTSLDTSKQRSVHTHTHTHTLTHSLTLTLTERAIRKQIDR
jgi:hypothetical protein